LIGMDGVELFDPQQFGMEPVMISTACWRGFYGTYELTHDAMYLRELTIHEKNNTYFPIDGTQPELGEYEAAYHNLNIKIFFTGKIRLASGFIEKYYIHMGFQKASAYKTVYDITIQNGEVLAIKDRSKEMKKKRGAFSKRYRKDNILGNIDEAFSLDMDLE